MSALSTPSDRRPLVEGSVVGLATWVLGYALTYAIVAADVEDSPLQRFVEFVDGSPATYEMVGWTFYNAHFVDTATDVPVVGGGTTSFIGGEGGFAVLLYAVPVGLLLAAGLATARSAGASTVNDGALAGLLVLPGYLLLSVAGVFLFEVAISGVSARPDLLPAVFLAGVVYPLLFGGAGGAVAGLTARR